MPTSIMRSTVTDAGRATIQERPERSSEVNQAVEALGTRVVGQWAVLGPYGVVTPVETPDKETIARVSVTLSARRTVHCLVMPPGRSCLPDGAQPASQRLGRLQERRRQGGR